MYRCRAILLVIGTFVLFCFTGCKKSDDSHGRNVEKEDVIVEASTLVRTFLAAARISDWATANQQFDNPKSYSSWPDFLNALAVSCPASTLPGDLNFSTPWISHHWDVVTFQVSEPCSGTLEVNFSPTNSKLHPFTPTLMDKGAHGL